MTVQEVAGGERTDAIEAANWRIAACAANCALRATTDGLRHHTDVFALEQSGGAKLDISTGKTLVPCPADGCPGEATVLLAGGPPIIFERALVPQSEA